MKKPGASSGKPGLAGVGFYALWLLSGLLELPLISVLSGRQFLFPLYWVCILHALAAVAAFFAAPQERGYFKPTRHWGEFMGLVTLLIPGVGWFIGGWLAARHPKAHHAKETYQFEGEDEEEMNPLKGGVEDLNSEELFEALDIMPAADALLGSDTALKRGAIEAFAKIRSRESIAWIKRAQKDRNHEVRFYATSTLTQLKRDYEMAIRAAEKEAFEQPGEIYPQTSVARVRYEYVRSGLLDEQARKNMLEQCAKSLGELSARDMEALRFFYLVERESDLKRALPVLERLRQTDSGQELKWRKEKVTVLFGLGRYSEIPAELEQIKGELVRDEVAAADRANLEWKSALLWWTHA